MEKKLLTIQQAADLLNVSKTTFGKIRREAGLSEIMVGKRPRFVEAELLAALPRVNPTPAPAPTKVVKPVSTEPVADLQLSLTSTHVLKDLEVAPNRFDLTRIRRIDPYGALSLLADIIVRARDGQKVELGLDSGPVCQILKSLHFFYHLESLGDGKVSWERSLPNAGSFRDGNRILPIRAIRAKGGERALNKELVESLKSHGFGPTLATATAQIVGELAMNSMTHSDLNLSDRVCLVCAQRAELMGENRVLLAAADLNTDLRDSFDDIKADQRSPGFRALFEAFRAHDDFWNSPTTGSLVDVASIVAGNGGQMRVDSGDVGIVFDFQGQVRMAGRAPVSETRGTRFGFVLRDRDFVRPSRLETDWILQEAAARFQLK